MVEQGIKGGSIIGESGILEIGPRVLNHTEPIDTLLEEVIKQSSDSVFRDDVTVFWLECQEQHEFKGTPETMPIRESFYSCFISYSSKDEVFAKRLYADLRDNGVNCWFAPEDIRAGRKLHSQVTDAIGVHDKLLLILSEQSLQSNWVETEIRNARLRERQEGRQKLFPVRLVSYEALQSWNLFDSDEGRDLATEVREYFIPDFSNWQDQKQYQEAFDRLLQDLRAE